MHVSVLIQHISELYSTELRLIFNDIFAALADFGKEIISSRFINHVSFFKSSSHKCMNLPESGSGGTRPTSSGGFSSSSRSSFLLLSFPDLNFAADVLMFLRVCCLSVRSALLTLMSGNLKTLLLVVASVVVVVLIL